MTAGLLALNARTFASLRRHRNYRLFFSGQLISLIGTWMQSLALSWLAYQLTHSAIMLGAVGFCSQIATFVLTPWQPGSGCHGSWSTTSRGATTTVGLGLVDTATAPRRGASRAPRPTTGRARGRTQPR